MVRDNGDDKYIHRNVARHLTQSKLLAELRCLLLDFRWTMRQLELNGILVLEKDFVIAMTGTRSNEQLQALEMIIGAARLSWPLIKRGEWNCLAFHMYGRLCNPLTLEGAHVPNTFLQW